MGKTYVQEKTLSFTLIPDDLKFTEASSVLDFVENSKTLVFKNETKIDSFDTNRPISEIIEKAELGFNLTKGLIFINISTELPSFLLASNNLNYINNSNTLSFKLDDFNKNVPEFQIVLEFFNETGGVF